MKNNSDEWIELIKIINQYILEKEWDNTETLKFLTGFLLRIAFASNISEKKFNTLCDEMKEFFPKMEEMKKIYDKFNSK